MKEKGRGRLCFCMLLLSFCILLSACGGETQQSGQQTGQEEASGRSYEVPKFQKAVFHRKKAEGNAEAKVDLSAVSQGYFAVHCNTKRRIKLQVIKDEITYTYDVPAGVDQIFPLQCGDGHYVIKIMKNLKGNKYVELYKCETDVKLKDEFQPYIRPNQYADYTQDSACVKKAAEFASKAAGANDFVLAVYDYITENISYDREKAATVKAGYLPDPDTTLAEKKGICFDYASLAASMLRSQGIPTKIIFGYVSPDNLYHAWNMFYTEEDGWTAVEFKADPNSWNRIDLTFAASGSDAGFIGDGSNYTDVYQY